MQKAENKTATIVGAGLVGSLWAVYLSKAGFKVRIFESRGDLRKTDISAGKSINLALSTRGWKAFRTVGVDKEIEKIAIPMYGRTMHDKNGQLTFQPYGKKDQAIYSVSRAGINCKMMDIAEERGNAEIFYNHKCVDADLEKGVVYLEDRNAGRLVEGKTGGREDMKTGGREDGKRLEVQSDLVFAADGAFSAVRHNAMQKLDRFDYSQQFIEDGYRELLLPANADGSYKMDKNSLHIWPRGRFMLIALPNEDGSFTCTLFMPHDKGENSFAHLNSKEKVKSFFQNTFPDFFELMPNVADKWEMHPLSSLAIIRCYPWTHGKTALMGDAAHATVPFYGQGMNCGFEDCTVMWELMQEHGDDWNTIFSRFQEMRKANGDAVQELSLANYYVMRDYVADPEFLLQKKFEHRMSELYPQAYIPLYSQVSFTHIPYAEALKKGKEQDAFVKNIMKENDIASLFEKDEIDALIHFVMRNREAATKA